ncbi:hypothetical protein XELAEV_18039968mg [Xenopus laevis]|uniref:Uncharacterized protein n=1 Tax=Xenopus laevis TaxID=8355 RepID=A0A974C8J8_XENLA|nr:hypothetical protein XELAEV_18039968mg [Xenopus laevis]
MATFKAYQWFSVLKVPLLCVNFGCTVCDKLLALLGNLGSKTFLISILALSFLMTSTAQKVKSLELSGQTCLSLFKTLYQHKNLLTCAVYIYPI